MLYGLALASVFLNINLFLLSSSVFVLALKPVGLGVASSFMRSVQSIPLVGPWIVGDSELLIDTFQLDDEHILGRHTIHILPHSLAHMNPSGKALCIDKGAVAKDAWYSRFVPGARHSSGNYQDWQVSIPIVINGTRPASITYARTLFETGQRQLVTVKKVGALRMETMASYPGLGSDWVLATYFLPANEEGAYELHSVRDSRGLEFRNVAGAQVTVVVGCPTARLAWRKQNDSALAVDSSGQASICQGAGTLAGAAVRLIDVVAEGYAPMDVSVVRLVNGRREAIELDRIKGENDENDESSGEYGRFQRRMVTYTLSDAVLQAGEYVYRLDSVRDAANHTVALAGPAVMARMEVHGRPQVMWTNGLGASSEPLWLSDDRQRASHHALGLRLVGQAPWTVDYAIDTGAGVLLRERRSFSESSGAAIDAHLAGVYSLVGVRDRHCTGAPVGAGTVVVRRAVRPEANVTSTPIMARECGGEIGAHVTLELSGRPPFAVHYRERSGAGRAAVRVVRTAQHRHVISVTPAVAGTYELEFFRIDDASFPSGQPMAAVVRQVVHAQPSASIDASRVAPVVCRGDPATVRVHLSGEAPWQLTYAVAQASRRSERNVTGIADSRYSIDVGQLAEPGEHVVDLVRVTDARGCARDLAGASATVRVRESGPHAELRCGAGGVRLREDDGAAHIPVALSGAEYPVALVYRRISDGAELRATIQRASSPMSVPAHGAGQYVLVSAKDTCPGSVDESPCAVHVDPRPHAWFASPRQLPSTCEGVPAAEPAGLALGLSGAGPWRVEYFVDYWAEKNSPTPDRSTLRSAVVLDPAVLPLDESRAPGRYRYRLSAVSDERYARPHPVSNSSDVLSVEHTITRSPIAVLRAYSKDRTAGSGFFGRARSRSQSVTHCLAPGQQAPASNESVSNESDAWARARSHLPEFRIEFTGTALNPPFDAWVEVVPAAGKPEVIELLSIPGSEHPVVLPDHIASHIGRYHLRLLRTRDSLGCEHRFPDTTASDLVGGGIDIEYIEAPTVRPASSSPASLPSHSVCIGDILAFDLRGLGPWSIDYVYNGARRSTTASKRLFRRIADVPGNFSLARVCHRTTANDCCSEFGDSLKYAVHDVPRVRVGRGIDAHQDILEGDFVHIPLYFTGQPPFTFAWQRRALSSSAAKSKILESHTVKDLDAYEYTITTSSEGTFEVTFIQDQHCQYPKA